MIDEILEDEVMRDIVSALYFLGEASPFELGKYTNHSPATITRRLQKLVEWGIIPPPEEDTSTGRLKRIYKRPSNEFYRYFTHFLYESFKHNEEQLHNFMINEMIRLFNIPLRWERNLEEILEVAKNPTTILLGLILGYWDVEDDKLKVTPQAVEHLKSLYKEAVYRHIQGLRLIDEEEALKFILKVLKKDFGLEFTDEQIKSILQEIRESS